MKGETAVHFYHRRGLDKHFHSINLSQSHKIINKCLLLFHELTTVQYHNAPTYMVKFLNESIRQHYEN